MLSMLCSWKQQTNQQSDSGYKAVPEFDAKALSKWMLTTLIERYESLIKPFITQQLDDLTGFAPLPENTNEYYREESMQMRQKRRDLYIEMTIFVALAVFIIVMGVILFIIFGKIYIPFAAGATLIALILFYCMIQPQEREGTEPPAPRPPA